MRLVSALLISVTLFLSLTSIFEVEGAHSPCATHDILLVAQHSDSPSVSVADDSNIKQISSQHICHIGHCAFLLVLKAEDKLEDRAARAKSFVETRINTDLHSELLRPPSIS